MNLTLSTASCYVNAWIGVNSVTSIYASVAHSICLQKSGVNCQIFDSSPWESERAHDVTGIGGEDP